MSRVSPAVWCVLAFGVGIGATLLVQVSVSEPPRILVRNGTDSAITLEALTLESLKWTREQAPGVLAPGREASFALDPRIGLAADLRLVYVEGGTRYEVDSTLCAHERETVSVEIRTGGHVRVGHRSGGEWRTWCSALTVRSTAASAPR